MLRRGWKAIRSASNRVLAEGPLRPPVGLDASASGHLELRIGGRPVLSASRVLPASKPREAWSPGDPVEQLARRHAERPGQLGQRVEPGQMGPALQAPYLCSMQRSANAQLFLGNPDALTAAGQVLPETGSDVHGRSSEDAAAGEQLIEAKRRSARPDAPTIAVKQPVSCQLANRSLDRIVAGEVITRVHPRGQLKDRQLRGMKNEDLGENRPLHDLVGPASRNLARLAMVVVHGS